MSSSLRQLSIVFAIALLVAAACGPATTPGPSGSAAASASPTAGGAASTLVIDRDTSDLISFDPAVLYEFIAARGDKLITDPRRRALLQRDLWALWDVLKRQVLHSRALPGVIDLESVLVDRERQAAHFPA